MTDRVVPLGRYLGMLTGPPLAGRSGRPTAELRGPHHTVRVGGRRVSISGDEMLVWALAHGVPGSPDLRHWDREALARHAPGAAGLDAVGLDAVGLDAAGLDAVADRLAAAGLLTTLGDGRPAADRFARAVRVFPLAVGLGNSAAQPRRFAVGWPGSPLATLSPGAFHLWSWAGLEPDLWSACRAAAASVGFAGAEGAHDLLADLLGALPDLLAVGAAYVDAAS